MPKNRSSDSYVEAGAVPPQGGDAGPRMLLDGIADYAVFMLDATGHVASWNPGGVRIHGYTAEKIIGQHVSVFFTKEDVATAEPAKVLATAETDGRFETEGWRLRANGDRFLAHIVINAIRNSDGGLIGFATVTRDITERSQAAPMLRAIVETAVDGIVTIDEKGRIASFNPAAQRLFGYHPDEVMHQNVSMLMPQPYRGHHDGYLANYRNTAVPKIIGIGREVTGRRKDGSLFPLDLSISEVKFGGSRLFTGIIREVTERKRTEEDRQRFVSLVENSSDFIAMASLEWQIFYLNKAACNLIGVAARQVTELEVRDLWHEDTLPLVIEQVLPTQITGASHRFEGRLRHFTTNEAIDVDCNSFCILDPDSGTPTAYAFSLRDIREQKRAGQALRDSEARIKAIVDNAVDGIITIDERGLIETVNPAAERIFGYAANELVGRNIKALMPEPYQIEHDQYLRNYRHTQQRKIIGIGREVIGQRRDGSVFPLDLSVSEVQLGDRRIFTGTVRDITERKRAEEHRDLLVAELSHRVKNALATVQSVAEQTLDDSSCSRMVRDTFDGRIRALAQTHSRLAESSWAGVGLRAVVADEMAPYRREETGNVVIDGAEVVLPPKIALSLGMAFHELATNAAKYGALSRQEGRVRITWLLKLQGEKRMLVIRWEEENGPPVVAPTRSGFGRTLIERGLVFEVRGKVALDFRADGVVCTIEFPLPDVPAEAGIGLSRRVR